MRAGASCDIDRIEYEIEIENYETAIGNILTILAQRLMLYAEALGPRLNPL